MKKKNFFHESLMVVTTHINTIRRRVVKMPPSPSHSQMLNVREREHGPTRHRIVFMCGSPQRPKWKFLHRECVRCVSRGSVLSSNCTSVAIKTPTRPSTQNKLARPGVANLTGRRTLFELPISYVHT